jgi:MFS family permease
MAHDTFASLKERNYRLYFTGQGISLVGTWLQMTALTWLVFTLSHHSATMVGLAVAAQYLPVLLFGAYGGVVADRVRKRQLLLCTQSALAVLALALGLLTITGVVQLWMVFAIAVLLGTVQAADNPARQSLMIELVGESRVRNAVSLNSMLVSASRSVGPAIAGVLIATVGTGECFLINAGSFLAVLAALAMMRDAELQRAHRVPRARGQVREGLRYVRGVPGLLIPLLMMALIGTLAYEFPVVLPALAHQTLHGGAETYGFMLAAMGVGALVGGLLVATYGVTGVAPLSLGALAFGTAILLAAVMPTLATEIAALTVVGGCSTAFIATGNSTLQLGSDPGFRGRVMALWAITFQGTTPIGGPLVGAVSEFAGPRYALALGGVSCLAAAALGVSALRRMPPAARRAEEAVARSA